MGGEQGPPNLTFLSSHLVTANERGHNQSTEITGFVEVSCFGMWGSVFKAANAVADEVEAAANLNPAVFSRKRKQIDRGDDGGEDESGAFKQPKRLAKFVSEVINSENRSESDEVLAEAGKQQVSDGGEGSKEVQQNQGGESEPQEKADGEFVRLSLEERCAKQICRKWLKHEYLKTDQACDGTCGRIHEAPDNPQKLYKDYSFKGLPPKQQKRILAAIMGKT